MFLSKFIDLIVSLYNYSCMQVGTENRPNQQKDTIRINLIEKLAKVVHVKELEKELEEVGRPSLVVRPVLSR